MWEGEVGGWSVGGGGGGWGAECRRAIPLTPFNPCESSSPKRELCLKQVWVV